MPAKLCGLNQGTIFNAVPCRTYSGYGVIVTADCDIANNKSQHVHYVVISPAKRYFCENFCKLLIYDRIELLCKNSGFDLEFIKMCNAAGINYDAGKIKNDIDSLFRAYVDCAGSCVAKNLITKSAISKINEVISDKITYLYYLQDIGLRDNSGYIADFRDIRQLRIDIAKEIVNGIESSTEIVNYKESGLSHSDGLIMPIGVMTSPQREHFMQRFSYSFVRIGLPDINKNTAERIVESF